MNERLARSLVLGPELLIAFLAIIASISGLVDPSVVERSSVGRELAPWDTIWNVAYGISGIVTIVGVVRGPRGRYLEAAGLSLLIAAVLIQTLAAVSVQGPGVSAGILTLVAVALFFGARIVLIVKGYDVALIRYIGDRDDTDG